MEPTLPRHIVGLGNPGSEYAGTRHNVGFMVVDHLLDAMVARVQSKRHIAESDVWEVRVSGRLVLLQKPMTYMNLSGRAVASLCRSQQLTPSEILVISDDVDLPFGRLRMRQEGGSGGHKGLANIIVELGSQSYSRLRVGIGRSPGTNSDTADFVLGPFSEAEKKLLPSVIKTAAEAVQTALRCGVASAMNRFNAWQPAQNEQQTSKDD